MMPKWSLKRIQTHSLLTLSRMAEVLGNTRATSCMKNSSVPTHTKWFQVIERTVGNDGRIRDIPKEKSQELVFKKSCFMIHWRFVFHSM